MKEFWKRRSCKQPILPGQTVYLDNNDGAFRQSKWTPCLQISVAGDPSSSHTNNRFVVLSTEAPTPCDENLRQVLRRPQYRVSQLGSRLQEHNAPESSPTQAGGRLRCHISSHRPQHKRQTLSPRHRSSLVQAIQRRQAVMSARWNQWSGRQDHSTSFRSTQQWRARDPSQVEAAARVRSPPMQEAWAQAQQVESTIASTTRQATPPLLPVSRVSSPPRREAQVRAQQVENTSISTTRLAAPPFLPTPSMSPRVHHAQMENRRKRERRRRNRYVLYQELVDLMLKRTQVCIRSDGEVFQENDRIALRISSSLERNEKHTYYLLKQLTRDHAGHKYTTRW